MLEDHLLYRVALLLAATLVLMTVAVLARVRGARLTGPGHLVETPVSLAALAGPIAAPSAATLPFIDPAIEVMTLAVYRRAFGATNFNYSILGEHRAVLERVRRELPAAAARREYFPRKPMIVPRLLSALKNSDSALKEIVGIIMQDPVLTGDVLRYANSPLYRITREPVDSIGRAVTLLGVDGLRALIATSVMQPVFQVPRGCFENFSATVWRQAQHAAFAAQVCARSAGNCDSFSAHLLALLFYMSHIVLFRMTAAGYVHAAGSLPRPEVFARLIDDCTEELAGRIATDWELPTPMITALAEHAARSPLEKMSPLAHALYFGRICGAASVAGDDTLSEEAFLQLLQRKGLDRPRAEALWRAAGAVDAAA